MKNIVPIIEFFKQKSPVNQDGLNELLEKLEVLQYKKQEIIQKENSYQKHFKFLNKGIVREYYTSEKGETNINFYTKSQFISDSSAINNNIATKKNQQALSDVEVLVIEKNDLLKLIDRYECGTKVLNNLLHSLLIKKEEAELNLRTKSPKHIYKDIVRNNPDWLNQIPQYHIASYLNITPETLSRIRKRIY